MKYNLQFTKVINANYYKARADLRYNAIQATRNYSMLQTTTWNTTHSKKHKISLKLQTIDHSGTEWSVHAVTISAYPFLSYPFYIMTDI
jgi:hypothetical protein